MTGGHRIHQWSEKEDAMLVDALMELHVSRKYVYADIDWEYVHAVQRLMDPNLFYATKTVKNRMRNMEINFHTVYEMLAGRKMRGFSWDREKSCVVADKQVWDKYVEAHPYAAQFRKRPFPHYEKLCVIYGFTGCLDGGLGGERVVGENHMKSCLDAKDLRVGEVVPSPYGRSLNEEINEAKDTMDKVMNQLEGLHGLSLDERLLAMSVIGRNVTLFRMFDRLDSDGKIRKIRMAHMVANGSIS